MRKMCCVLVLLRFAPLHAQETLLDSLVRQHTYSLKIIRDSLSGSGVDFILDRTRTAQFVNLGEEHNAKDIPIFTTALFKLLQNRYGFKYLALEQDPFRMRSVSTDPSNIYKGNLDSAFSLLMRFPYSYTFASDQEVAMIANVNKLSKARHDPVWGCDQAFGAMHYLDELIKTAPGQTARRYTKELMDSVWIIENNRDNPEHYMSHSSKVKEEFFDRLSDLYKPAKSSREEWLISTLASSYKIYHAGKYTPYPAGANFHNNVMREDYMKERFVEEYNSAVKKEGRLPKVILKFGQWHLANGFGPNGILTLGNFSRSLARYNRMDCFSIDMEIIGSPGSNYYKYVMGHDILKIFAARTNINEWIIIDLVPFRYYFQRLVSRKLIPAELQDRFNRYILNFDALLFFGNGEPATYIWKQKQ